MEPSPLVKWLSCSGGELENQQRKYPRSVLSDAENVAIQRARTDAEMRALMGGKAAVFASGHSTAWSVLYRELDGSGADEDVASLMSPLNRTVTWWRCQICWTLPED